MMRLEVIIVQVVHQGHAHLMDATPRLALIKHIVDQLYCPVQLTVRWPLMVTVTRIPRMKCHHCTDALHVG